MQSVIEHLCTHAPANASFYRLVGRTPQGEYQLYPRDNYSVYGHGEAPRGLLPGLYQVFYFDSTGRQIQTARVELRLTEAAAAALGPIEGATRADSVAQRALAASNVQLSLPLPSGPPLSPSAQPDLAREQAEHRMTLESDQQKHAFIHSSEYAREMGEALMLNRMMRQEMYELTKKSRAQSQEAYADIEKQLATLRMVREAQKEVLQYVKEEAQPPPPQKIDWLPLAHEGIRTIQEIGLALLQSQRAPAPPQAVPQQAAPVQRPSADAGSPMASPARLRVQSPSMEMQSSPAPLGFDASTLPERPESD